MSNIIFSNQIAAWLILNGCKVEEVRQRQDDTAKQLYIFVQDANFNELMGELKK